MSPRRLAQSLREQNWTTIFIEFVLLVLGVFLGIQVANWNEDRQLEARRGAASPRHLAHDRGGRRPRRGLPPPGIGQVSSGV